MLHHRPIRLAISCFWICSWFASQTAVAQSPDSVDYFERHIRPLLIEHCYECHSLASGKSEGDLRLDSAEAMRTGGYSGAVVGGDQPAEESLLWHAVSYTDAALQMPPGGKLPAEKLEMLRAWLEAGAVDPRNEADATKYAQQKQQQVSEHWAFQPVCTTPPDCKLAGRTPIDAAIAAASQPNAEPLPIAGDRTIVTRLYHDLHGILPTAEQIERYLSDDRPDKLERLIERLLSAPAFGERMARRWMDVSRYADNKGYVFQEDREYPHAYRYRQWLIDAFNDDMPYDQFVRFQLAADHYDDTEDMRHAAAAGFIMLGRRFLNNTHDIIDDRIDVVSRGLLGLSVSCARCHDHKFDPISMGDYYSLYAAFRDSEEAKEFDGYWLTDKAEPRPAVIFLRGQPGNRGDQVDKQFVRFISLSNQYKFEKGSGRKDLADAVVDPKNPLTPRVYANRLWGWTMGRSLNDSPSDYGLRSPQPTQLPLLDHLASRLLHSGWSTKEIIREIVLSEAYRRESVMGGPAAEVDPTNDSWWRAEPRRLEFETLRDRMLQSAGALDRRIGGESENIFAIQPSRRRTLYAYIDRQNLPSTFRSFDLANPDAHAPQRLRTTVPQQFLYLQNSPEVLQLAEKIAARCDEDNQDNARLVEQLFIMILQRSPSPQEKAGALQLIDAAANAQPPIELNPWSYLTGQINQSGAIQSTEPVPMVSDKRYAFAAQLPDPRAGWIHHEAESCHPGQPLRFTAIRRYTSPASGSVKLRGFVEHGSDQGDGVRLLVVLNRDNVRHQFEVKNKRQGFQLPNVSLTVGDTVDFIVDAGENASFDSCKVRFWVEREGGPTADSRTDFRPPPPSPLTPPAILAHALLMSNEFQFVD